MTSVVADAASQARSPEGGIPSSPPRSSSWRASAAIAVTILALLPVLVTVVLQAGRNYLPVGDIGVIDLHVRDVFTGGPPLVGPYSRFGWSHPGPTFYYLLAPLNALFGGAPWTTLVGSAVLQGIGIAWTAWLAWRRGGLTLTIAVLAVLSLAYSAMGPLILLEAWNPHVVFPFVAVFILQVWSVALGDRWQIVGAGIVGTFLVQTHIGYAPLVIAGAVWAGVLVCRDSRHEAGAWARLRTPLFVALGVTVLMWVPPIIEQFTDRDGNLSRLATYFLHGNSDVSGVGTGLGLFAAEFRVLPPWLGGRDLLNPFVGSAEPASSLWLLIPLGLLLAGGWASHRLRSRPIARLLSLMTVMVGAALFALARVVLPAFPYLFYWRIVVAPLVVMAAVWAITSWLRFTNAPRVRLVGAALLVAATAWSAGTLAIDIADPASAIRTEGPTRDLVAQLEARGLPNEPFVIRLAGSPLGGVETGVIDALDRRGAPVRVDASLSFQFGDRLGFKPTPSTPIWYVTEDGNDVSLMTENPDATVLARTSPLTPAEESDLVTLQRLLGRQLQDQGRADLLPVLDQPGVASLLPKGGRFDQQAVERVAQLNAKVERSGGCRCAVIKWPQSS